MLERRRLSWGSGRGPRVWRSSESKGSGVHFSDSRMTQPTSALLESPAVVEDSLANDSVSLAGLLIEAATAVWAHVLTGRF